MKKWFLNKSLNFISKFNDYDQEELDKIRYGLEGLYLTITKSIVIILIAIILGITKELIIVLILFNLLRFTGFGFHANSSTTCLIVSTILFIGFPYIALKLYIDNNILVLITIISLLTLGIYAPADTPKRPLPNVKKRKIRKLATIIIALIYIIGILVFRNTYFSLLIICALLIEAIMVHPFTYKLFKQSYNNYKNISC